MARMTILSAPLQATAGTGVAFSLTATVNERGVIHLADAILSCNSDAARANHATDLSDLLEIQTLEVNGSVVLVRGRNTPAPGNFLTPNRQGNFVDLPAMPVDSGDTILVTAIYTYTAATGDARFSIPFSPARLAQISDPAMPFGEVAIGSPSTAVTDGAATALTITFENYGLIDLDRLTLYWSLLPTASISPYGGTTVQKWGGITAMTLRNDYPMVVGQNTPQAASGFFAPDRIRNRVLLGRHRVTPGDQFSATVVATTGANGNATICVPQFLTGADHGGVGTPQAPCP